MSAYVCLTEGSLYAYSIKQTQEGVDPKFFFDAAKSSQTKSTFDRWMQVLGRQQNHAKKHDGGSSSELRIMDRHQDKKASLGDTIRRVTSSRAELGNLRKSWTKTENLGPSRSGSPQPSWDRSSTESDSSSGITSSSHFLERDILDRGHILTSVEVSPRYVPFAWFGEMALFSKNDVFLKWEQTFQVAEFSTILTISRVDFDEALRRNPEWRAVVEERRRALAEEEVKHEDFGCRRCGGTDHGEATCEAARCERHVDIEEGFWCFTEMVRRNSTDSKESPDLAAGMHYDCSGNPVEAWVRNVNQQPISKDGVRSFVEKILIGDIEADEIVQSLDKFYPEMTFYALEERDGSKCPMHDRTVHAVLSAFWILNGRYAEFVQNQKEDQKLYKESWMAVCMLCQEAELQASWEAFDCLIVGFVLRFLAKVKTWRLSFGGGISDADVAAVNVLIHHADACPSFQRLPQRLKNQVLSLLELDGRFNLAQLMQAENLPESVNCYKKFIQHHGVTYQRLYEFRWFCWMSSILGHKSLEGSLFMTEANYQMIQMVISGVKNLSKNGATDIYNQYLALRARSQGLSAQTDEERAIVRLACFTRSYTPAAAARVEAAFGALSPEDQVELVGYLRHQPASGQPGILLMYAPDFMLSVQNNPGISLVNGLKIMLRVYEMAAQEYRHSREQVVVIICQELTKFATKVGDNETFMNGSCHMELHRSAGVPEREASLILNRMVWKDLLAAEEARMMGIASQTCGAFPASEERRVSLRGRTGTAASSTSSEGRRMQEANAATTKQATTSPKSGPKSTNTPSKEEVIDGDHSVACRLNMLEEKFEQVHSRLSSGLENVTARQQQQEDMLEKVLAGQLALQEQLQQMCERRQSGDRNGGSIGFRRQSGDRNSGLIGSPRSSDVGGDRNSVQNGPQHDINDESCDDVGGTMN
eukprot:gnl/TRDRNA2_/TRDRNA2_165464_c1_seq2.p1 gnl/TRDRNA2_/TRDRNA2_165464_c1~~gnl/TRDRNA2_/TRDRNA2_165464_c1_seq2.p1  ORF type:complete len:950 (+),score=170.06 gnl/TRDRNA2_/TRDRNA2_165464_c1_seq2:57-2852(+)